MSYTIQMNANERGNQWHHALKLLANCHDADVILFNATINACATEWQQCFVLLSHMQRDKVESNSNTFSAIISACRNGREWTQALQTLRLMHKSGMQADVSVFNAALNACGRAEHWAHALAIMTMMEQAGSLD